MALTTCSECGKSISDTATACPNCGYGLRQVTARNYNVRPSMLGGLKKNKREGIFLCIIGGIAIILGIPLIAAIVGIFVIIGGIILLGLGIGRVGGYYDTTCPHCGKKANITKSARSFKCPVCKKQSYPDGQYLRPVQ